MRFILRFRPLYFMRLRNWYGIRKGNMWLYPEYDRYIFMIDIGSITIGYAVKADRSF